MASQPQQQPAAMSTAHQQQAILALQLQAAAQAQQQQTPQPSAQTGQNAPSSQVDNAAAAQTVHTTSSMQPTSSQPQFDLTKFWQTEMGEAHEFDSDFKNHPLPLARIKKVMKSDQDVKMISAEAPILFAKGCEIFIAELTQRAWIHAEENKRRTLQRSDIATAISKTDMCDFLIDIVPREEIPRPPMRGTVVGKREDGTDIFDQSPYAAYYPLGTNAASYGQGQPLDPATYYQQMAQLAGGQLSHEQLQHLQQYQNLQQQYAQAQQQQQQQQPPQPPQPQQQPQPQPQQSQPQPPVSTQVSASQAGTPARAASGQQGR